jgi:putative iron-dependent peroxidase
MATGQPGIFAQGTRAHHHLELDLRPGAGAGELTDALRALREPAVTVGGLNIVIGLGAEAWAMVAPEAARPAALRPFDRVGEGAPATQHDVWIWLHGTGTDLLLDGARAASAALAPVAHLAQECPGFVYHDSRDLTGFIDGTANPPIHEAPGVALIEDGAPGEGGAYALAMRWIHDLESFHRLPLVEQELVIGRTKPDSVELDDDVKPPNAHIARVELEEDGEELELWRRSVPYGTVEEHGLFFVAFSADIARFDKMLARMFGTAEDGLHDRLTEFTRPVSGAYYFVPSLEALEEVCAR